MKIKSCKVLILAQGNTQGLLAILINLSDGDSDMRPIHTTSQFGDI